MATIYDIAKRAGVSASTVSLAFNQPHRLKAETKARVLQIAKDLRYQPNHFAKALAGGRSKLIGLLVSDIRFPSTAASAWGVEEVLSESGFATFVASTDGDKEKVERLVSQFLAQGVGGFIFRPAQFGLTKALLKTVKDLKASKVPVVVVGHDTTDPDIDHVTFLPQHITQEAVDYLINLGHKDIALIGGIPEQGVALPRYLGYQQSLFSNGLSLQEDYLVRGQLTPEVGFDGLVNLMNLAKPPTAVLAMNDVVAIGIIDACVKNGVRLPEDLSLVSFDSGALYERKTPAVTSMVIPMHEMGRQAAKTLLKRWHDESLPPQRSVVECYLEVRETTAPPKDRVEAL